MKPPKSIIQIAELEASAEFYNFGIPLDILRDDVTRAIKKYREAKQKMIDFENEQKEIRQWLDSINDQSINIDSANTKHQTTNPKQS
jgi:hypothetical protein